eukprot:CFRG7726T1
MDLVTFTCLDEEKVSVPRRIVEAVDWMPRTMINTKTPTSLMLDIKADVFRRIVDRVYIDHVDDRDLTEAMDYLSLVPPISESDTRSYFALMECNIKDSTSRRLVFSRYVLKVTVQVAQCNICGDALTDSPNFSVLHHLGGKVFLLRFKCIHEGSTKNSYELVGARVTPLGVKSDKEKPFIAAFKGEIRLQPIEYSLLFPRE